MFIILLLLLIPFAACQEVEFSTRPNNVSILLLYFTQRSTETATILSPFGLWSLMSAISFGATGDTYREIFRAFLLFTDKNRFNTNYKTLIDTVFKTPTSGVNVANNNFIFIDTNFNAMERDYKNFLIENYNSSVVYFDFENLRATADRANTLIRIRSPPVTNVYTIEDFRGSSLMMSNIVYFQGVWSLPFNMSNTRLEQVNGGEEIIPVMYQRGKVPYSHLDSMKASVMELAYGNDGKYCMLIITPDPNVPLMTVYKKFEKVTFRNIFNKLQNDVNEFGLKEIDIKLPRFRKSSYHYLKKPLNDMGIYQAFEPELARFQLIAREPIYIDAIEQKTDFYITEYGTVAYASTPGRGNSKQTAQDIAPSNMLLFIIEKTTTTIIFGGIFP
ncbi:unnamed protein product, partial [Brenthis ino]